MVRKQRSDKGKKRASYDMTKRNIKTEYNRLQQALKATRPIVSPVDANVIKGLPRYIRRQLRRNKALPKNRRCPECGRGPILKSRSWVVKDGKTMCRSCWWKKIK